MSIVSRVRVIETLSSRLIGLVGLLEQEVGGQLLVLVASEVCLDDEIPLEAEPT